MKVTQVKEFNLDNLVEMNHFLRSNQEIEGFEVVDIKYTAVEDGITLALIIYKEDL